MTFREHDIVVRTAAHPETGLRPGDSVALTLFSVCSVVEKASLRRLEGGDKTEVYRFYEAIVPQADRRYEQHLRELIQEGLI